MNDNISEDTDMKRVVTWSSYPIESLCEIESGRDIYDSERIPGGIPYCSATSVNNGIGYFVGNRNETLESECIQVNRNGSVGFAAYHPYPALYSNDCRKLRPFVKSRFVSLFFVNQIMMQRKKYGYGYKMGTARLKKQSIMLPSDVTGHPDYSYMADFVRERESLLLEKYLSYARIRIAECELFMKGDFTLSVKDRKWMPIQISSMFYFRRGSENNMAILETGDVPLISAKNGNNGLKGFVDNPKIVIDGSCITLNNDGDGGAGLAYYQPFNMALDTHVTALIPKEKMNRETLLFISRCLSGLHGFFGHGLSISNKRMDKIRVMLPVDGSGNPDYAFMDEFVRERESTECWKSICSISQSQDVPDLSEKEWGRYTFDEIFEIRSGKRLENRNKVPGDIPFVGASDSNNGITGFVGNINESLDSKTLGVSYNGAPCIAFHHPYECIFTDDVKHLHLKEHDDNEYVHLFLATVIGMQRMKYSYGYKFNEQRMRRQMIMLPVTDDGNPDYEYMENYVRFKESVLLRRYYDYVESKSVVDRYARIKLQDFVSSTKASVR